MANEVGKVFVQESVIGLGFFSGIGIDPEGMILSALSSAIPNQSFGLKFLIFLLPWLITLASIYGAFVTGGWFGIGAVVLAFIGGIFINTKVGVGLLIIGILIGLVAPNLKENHNPYY